MRQLGFAGAALAVALCALTSAACEAGSPPSDARAGVGTEPASESSGPGATGQHQSKPKKHKKMKESGSLVRVARVVDGDTLTLQDGRRVRLVQIDTPELGGGECYSRKAASALGALAPPGATVRLEADPALDRVDRYGRLLRYVFRAGTNVNLELVRLGAASVWFYDGDHGRYADQLLSAAEKAEQDRVGAWGACEAELDPLAGFETAPKHNRLHTFTSSGNCEPGYDPCLPITDDLDCADVDALGITSVRVVGTDRYRLDGDGDGIGCE